MPWPATHIAVCDVEGLLHHQPLSHAEHRGGQVIPLADLPHAFARVAAVVAPRDRPQRVAWLDDVRAGPRRAARRPREDDPRHEESENEACHAHEHMYAWYSEQTFVSRAKCDQLGTRRERLCNDGLEHRSRRSAAALGRAPWIEDPHVALARDLRDMAVRVHDRVAVGKQ